MHPLELEIPSGFTAISLIEFSLLTAGLNALRLSCAVSGERFEALKETYTSNSVYSRLMKRDTFSLVIILAATAVSVLNIVSKFAIKLIGYAEKWLCYKAVLS